MNHLKLKEAMNQVHMKKEMQEEIIMNVKQTIEYRQRRAKKTKKAAATAAVFAFVLAAAIPIQAGIRHLVKDRMENIPKQELEAVNQMLQDQDNVQADGFSREYSSEEKIRMQELEQSYLDGIFPAQTITLKDSSGQIPEESICYVTDTGTFHLPDRPLTDEEMLQIIDFNYTTDYALTHSEAAQKEKEAWGLEENRLEETIQAENGISRQEAQKRAEMYLQTEFGLSADGMETDIFLDQQPDGITIYHVSFQTQDDTYYYVYGIDLDAMDGSLVNTSHASLPIRTGTHH